MLAKTPPHTIIDRTSIEQWRRALLEGADYIERNGHCKNDYYKGSGPLPKVCALGSLLQVGNISAGIHLERFIGKNVGTWNDHPNTTAEQVIQTMRACALQGIDTP